MSACPNDAGDLADIDLGVAAVIALGRELAAQGSASARWNCTDSLINCELVAAVPGATGPISAAWLAAHAAPPIVPILNVATVAGSMNTFRALLELTKAHRFGVFGSQKL